MHCFYSETSSGWARINHPLNALEFPPKGTGGDQIKLENPKVHVTIHRKMTDLAESRR